MTPDRAGFRELAQQGDLIPVYHEILADLETPVSAFQKLGEAPYAFLLESVTGGEQIGRYSFLGAEPTLVVTSKGRLVTLQRGDHLEEHHLAADEDPLHVIQAAMGSATYVPHGDLPPFIGGAVGYLGYDLVRFFEKLPDTCDDDLQLPDTCFLITGTCLVFDRVLNRAKVVAMARVGGDPDAAYDAACEAIEGVLERLRAPLPARVKPERADSLEVGSNLSRAEYEQMVLAAKEYIAAGDIIQVVPSQRFSAATSAAPFDVYRALRSINPSPYMFYLRLGDIHLAGASPEILVTEQDGLVRTRPIAGTRRRGRTSAEDEALATELLADEKELAEHIMLVDLGRNDLGRVSEYGSVSVDELMVIERYSHVMHIVSNVTGRLRADCDKFDVLRAAFPAGTLTGAPKIRAMQIIDELEPTRRGPYGGAIGYFSYSGSMDTAITIRTAVLRDGVCYWQAGGGVVADSDPSAEYEESCSKALAIRRALELAESGLE
ncbi:MAG: anthranilate synthase component I [Fimbriimonadaceae bacterium]|nr:anthranilate synthase component I [Fimbriimonadaceae bacterium]